MLSKCFMKTFNDDFGVLLPPQKFEKSVVVCLQSFSKVFLGGGRGGVKLFMVFH